MIKTKNIISHCYLISMLSSRNLPVVISGENGSGKSTLLNFYFKENLDEKLMGLL
jgi:ABC-type molybdenum transport system ATPase subunit/photorepair protein PhrA